MEIKETNDGHWTVGQIMFDSRESAELFAESRKPAAAPVEEPKPSPTPLSAGQQGLRLIFGLCAVFFVYVLLSGPSGPEVHQPHEAKGYCEERLRALLKAPATAKFSDMSETRFTGLAGMGPFTATGHVDAQNSFGALIRNQYRCTVTFREGRAYTSNVSLY